MRPLGSCESVRLRCHGRIMHGLVACEKNRKVNFLRLINFFAGSPGLPVRRPPRPRAALCTQLHRRAHLRSARAPCPTRSRATRRPPPRRRPPAPATPHATPEPTRPRLGPSAARPVGLDAPLSRLTRLRAKAAAVASRVCVVMATLQIKPSHLPAGLVEWAWHRRISRRARSPSQRPATPAGC